MTIKLDEDGITHINVYSKAQTPLGKFLSNFAYYPMVTEDGVFNSIEGYWYWLSSRDDELRKLSGYKAKEYGRKIKASEWSDDPEFKRKILAAIETKILTSGYLPAFKESTLPFVHYYNYGAKIIMVPECDWIMEFLEQLRKRLTEN